MAVHEFTTPGQVSGHTPDETAETLAPDLLRIPSHKPTALRVFGQVALDLGAPRDALVVGQPSGVSLNPPAGETG